MPISRHARITRRAISPRLATRMRWNIVPLATGPFSGHVVVRRFFLASRCRESDRKRPLPSANWGTAPRPVSSLKALTRTDAEQRLTELDRIAVLNKNFDDCSADFGRNLVEDLHRLDNADDGFGRDPGADRHKRGIVRCWGAIKGSHRGTVDCDRAVGRRRSGWRGRGGSLGRGTGGSLRNRWADPRRVSAQIGSAPQRPFL